MNDKDKILKWIKENPIDFSTFVFCGIGLVTFAVRLIYEIKIKTELKVILEMSANYVTIISCIVVLIQLFAFISDSKHKEKRCRKEAALDIAQKYADDLLGSISLIQNVLSISYDDKDFQRLEKILSEIKIDSFTKKSLNKNTNSDLKQYIKMVQDPVDISLNLLLEQVQVFDMLDLRSLKDVEQKHHKLIANRKFTVLINKTMNTLEYFAMSVNQNVAESEMLFSSLHQTYLKFVRYMYPRICELNAEEEIFYLNVIELYRSWQKRLENIEAEKAEEEQKVEERNRGRYSRNKPL